MPYAATSPLLEQLTNQFVTIAAHGLLGLRGSSAMSDETRSALIEDCWQMLPGGVDAGWEVNAETMAP
jgi:hypothetical protein